MQIPCWSPIFRPCSINRFFCWGV